ncbi:hypothetical protein WJ967_04445 [Achromobacter xylosoxidans]
MKKGVNAWFSWGNALFPLHALGKECCQPAADGGRTTPWIQPKNVQNHYSERAVASLLRNELLMPENNYPQTYPKAENMLVITNCLYAARENAPRPQRNNAPDREVLGRCSRPAWHTGNWDFPI